MGHVTVVCARVVIRLSGVLSGNVIVCARTRQIANMPRFFEREASQQQHAPTARARRVVLYMVADGLNDLQRDCALALLLRVAHAARGR